MAGVVLDNVNKTYPNGFRAVEDLTLEIHDGEFLVLVGPSGCGKSTALRMVAGLEEITDGELRIDGVVVNEVEPKDRDIAMVFQNYALYPHMTVSDNIGFSLKLSKLPKTEIAERVRTAASTLDLTEQLDKKPAHLSGGQRQRVAMGRAIVRKPKAFLMDEPLSNLDAKLRVQMRAEIAGLQRTLGVTTVYVTHDQVEAMTMGDRVAVLKRGVLQQVDTPQNLYDFPHNVFVAGFIGSPSMNLMKGRLQQMDGSLQVVLGDQTVQLPTTSLSVRPRLAEFIDRDLVVGLRPEDISDAALDPESPVERHIATSAALVEALGSELIVHFPLPVEAYQIMDQEHEGDDAVAPATDQDGNYMYLARVSPRSAAKLGAPIELALDVDRFHFFDPADGSAISGQAEVAQ